MQSNHFPLGWVEERVQRLLAYSENQSAEETIAEDEIAFLARNDWDLDPDDISEKDINCDDNE